MASELGVKILWRRGCSTKETSAEEPVTLASEEEEEMERRGVGGVGK